MLALLAASPLSHADTAYDTCFLEAGARFRIAPRLLEAIARTESGLDPLAHGTNRNGSEDVGLMQVNSRWRDELAALGIEGDSLWNPCLNIHVGAWILARNVRRYGYTWTAVGAYHAGTARDEATERRRRAYALRVSRHLSPDRGARVRNEAGAAPRDDTLRADRAHRAARGRPAPRPPPAFPSPVVRDLQAVSRADPEDRARPGV